MVRTLVDLKDDDVCVPAGTVGTIVGCVPEDDAFVIEFDEPAQAVIGVRRKESEPV